MIVRCLNVVDFFAGDRQFHLNPGDVKTIDDIHQAQSLIASGYVEEVVMCSSCGGYAKKA